MKELKTISIIIGFVILLFGFGAAWGTALANIGSAEEKIIKVEEKNEAQELRIQYNKEQQIRSEEIHKSINDSLKRIEDRLDTKRNTNG